MNTLLEKYLNKGIEIHFKPLLDGNIIEIILIDASYGIEEHVFILKDVFFTFHTETIESYLNPAFAKMGSRKAKIYGDQFSSHQRKEFEKFWKEDKDIFVKNNK